MKHLKVTSALLSAAMSMSMVMTPVAVMADETAEPTETQTIEAAEKQEPSETEKKETEATEKQEPSETETEEPSETEEQKPSETEKEQPSETEEQKPSESENEVPTETQTEEPAETDEQKPEEQTPEVVEEPAPETEVKNEAKNAISGKCGDNLHWNFDASSGTLTISGQGSMYGYKEYNGSDSDDRKLTPWLDHNAEITTVVIGHGATTVGSYSFAGCKNLTSVTLPDTIKAIGYGAFSGCTSLSNITFPAKLESISGNAFILCTSLGSIDIPDTVKKIGDSAFESCKNLSSVKLSAKLEALNASVFEGCESLSSITIPDKVESIGEKAFNGCLGLSSISIPKSVTSLGSYCFAGCTNLNSIVLPSSITDIPSRAFSNCLSLSDISIPISVKSIGSYAFERCLGFNEINIPYSVRSIGECAFEGCTNMDFVKLDEPVYKNCKDTAFKNCPAEAKFLQFATNGEYATVNGLKYKVTDATKYGSGTVILYDTDSSMPADVTIPNYIWIHDCTYKVTKVYTKTFYRNTTLQTLYIGNNVISLGAEVCSGCTSLTKVSGGGALTTIGSKAFVNCKNLSSFVITSSKLKKIGTYSFWGDSLLKLVNVYKTTKLTKAGVKKSLKGSSVTKVKVKKTKVSAYKKYFTKKNCGKKVSVTK